MCQCSCKSVRCVSVVVSGVSVAVTGVRCVSVVVTSMKCVSVVVTV